MNLIGRIARWVWPFTSRRERYVAPRHRGPVTHVVIIDGTMSTLKPGCETNAGLLFDLLNEAGVGANFTLHYQQGIQWEGYRKIGKVIAGRGLNTQIERAYGALASRYRPGDRIFLFGFSRGAYAVRSLAGAIDLVGLLSTEHAIERNVRDAYRHYRTDPNSAAARAFAARYCHDETRIEFVGVWDTVKALGVRLPLLWRLWAHAYAFHNHELGRSTRNGYQALALHERRVAYQPILWSSPPDWPGHIEQVWFRGVHGDIGGHVLDHDESRPLSNIPLVWMLDKAQSHGLPLPEGWRDRFPQDPAAPSVGMSRGWGKLFLARQSRVVGRDCSESIHETARD